VDTAAETLRLVEAVCALGDRVHLEVVERDEPGPWPQLTIGDGLVYRGMPLGYELAALVYAIVEAGRRASTLTAESLGQLAGLTRPVELRVYVTPT
jgi:alkyl hydroperoxide reductase subunit AhpF